LITNNCLKTKTGVINSKAYFIQHSTVNKYIRYMAHKPADLQVIQSPKRL